MLRPAVHHHLSIRPNFLKVRGRGASDLGAWCRSPKPELLHLLLEHMLPPRNGNGKHAINGTNGHAAPGLGAHSRKAQELPEVRPVLLAQRVVSRVAADVSAGDAGRAPPGRRGRWCPGSIPGAPAYAGHRPGLCGRPAAAGEGEALTCVPAYLCMSCVNAALPACAAVDAKQLLPMHEGKVCVRQRCSKSLTGGSRVDTSRLCIPNPLSLINMAGAGRAAASAAAAVQHLVVTAGGRGARRGDCGGGALREPGPAAHRRHLHLHRGALEGAPAAHAFESRFAANEKVCVHVRAKMQ